MARITFVDANGSQRTVDASPGDSLMTVAVNNDVRGIEGECGGEKACGTCHVRVVGERRDRVPGPGEEESELIAVLVLGDVRDDSRLGCQIQVGPELDGLTVVVPGG